MLKTCGGKEKIHMGFCNLSLSILISSFQKQPYRQDVNLFHEPLIAVDRLLGLIGAVYNDKD